MKSRSVNLGQVAQLASRLTPGRYSIAIYILFKPYPRSSSIFPHLKIWYLACTPCISKWRQALLCRLNTLMRPCNSKRAGRGFRISGQLQLHQNSLKSEAFVAPICFWNFLPWDRPLNFQKMIYSQDQEASIKCKKQFVVIRWIKYQNAVVHPYLVEFGLPISTIPRTMCAECTQNPPKINTPSLSPRQQTSTSFLELRVCCSSSAVRF